MDAPQNSPTARTAAARRVAVGFGPREIGIGVVAIGILLGGAWLLVRSSGVRRHAGESREVLRELAAAAVAANEYEARCAVLQRKAAEARHAAETERSDAGRRWLHEQALRYDAVLAVVNREPSARRFAAAAQEAARLANRGDVAAAKRIVAVLEVPRVPPPGEFERVMHDLYEAPLARFSRQEPALYRAFRQYEPEASRRDETALRSDIAAAADAVTPQIMAEVDLLAAVSAADDPVVGGWAERASALEYFERPDPATLARWGSARKAMHAGDWPAAAAQMQAILKSTVRTRQPFRAAFGRALLKSRPDQPAAAYAFMAEAAAAGDKAARAWVSEDDVRNRRFTDARRWLEARVADGETAAESMLVASYQQAPDSADPAAMRAALERITERPDAPADAWLLLGTLYERVDPRGESAGKAYACYARAAAKGAAKAHVQVARCALSGRGTARDPDAAREEACRAFALGEREGAAPILLQLLHDTPERTAAAVQRLFGEQSVAGGGGFMRSAIIDGPGVTALKTKLARYLDQSGALADAARLYAGLGDPVSASRRAELIAGHPCETCGGAGKVVVSVPCPTCGGKGSQTCSFCGGTGFIYVPGTPPCGVCGGAGTMVQDGKIVACAGCGGTGKGKGSVLKQDCPQCDHGRIACADCTGGLIKTTKECPDCHGRGAWTLVERGRG